MSNARNTARYARHLKHKLLTQRQAYRKRIRELEDALKPFARLGDQVKDYPLFPDGMLLHFPMPVDTYRRASRVLSDVVPETVVSLEEELDLSTKGD